MLNKGIKYTLLTVIVPILLQIYFLHYISFNVPKALFGDFTVIYVFIFAIVQLFTSIPLQSLNRFYNEASCKEEYINEYRTIGLYLSVVSCLSVLVMFGLYRERFSLLEYAYAASLLLILVNYAIGQQIFLINLQRVHYFYLKAAEGAAKFAIPLIFYQLYGGVDSLLLGMLIGYIISYIMFIYLGRNVKFESKLVFVNLKKYTKYAYPIVFSTVASLIITFSDRFFVDYYAGVEKLGIYSVLCQFAGFAQVIGIAYATYTTPILLKQFEESPTKALIKVKKYLLVLFLMLTLLYLIFLAVPKFILAMLVSPDIIYEQEFYLTFSLIVASVFLAVFQTALSIYFVFYKRLLIHAGAFFAVAVLNFAINFGIEKYGMIMAAISTLIAYTILTIFIFYWVSVKANNKGLDDGC